MSIEKTKEYMAIMQAYLDGKKIEIKMSDWWRECVPLWNWSACTYRIAPSTPDTINWDHVAPEFKWMARDDNGDAWIYERKPTKGKFSWFVGDGFLSAKNFTSYTRGTCDWTESLVERTEK